MSHYQLVLFDLDGTLTNSKLGITKSVQYALQKLGIQVKHLDELIPFIGPPLPESFTRFYDMDRDTVGQAVAYYREYFAKTGIFENELYPGIAEVLEGLVRADVSLAVATSKPTVYAEPILEHFKIREYFQVVVGSPLDSNESTKTDIIKETLALLSLFGKDRSNVVMVGDRQYDVVGAKNVGVDSIGVTYGFGSIEELKMAGATHLAATPLDVAKIVLG